MEETSVTIVLFAYNAEKFISKAIESLLQQSFPDFELLILDDASTDNTPDIISGFEDKRIRVIRHDVNQGIAFNRRLALQLVRSEFIFWMDNDDISHPDRVKKQLQCFREDPQLVLCGSFSYVIDDEGIITGLKQLPVSDEAIKASMLFTFPFVSPSVGIRMSAVKKEAIDHLKHIEQADDYVLYSAMMESGRFKNINEPLYYYREHQNPVRITTDKKRGRDIQNGRYYAWNLQLEQLQVKCTTEVLELHDMLTYYRELLNKRHLDAVMEYKELLDNLRKKAAQRSGLFSRELQRHIDFKVTMLILSPINSFSFSYQLLYLFQPVISSRCKLATFAKVIKRKIFKRSVPV